MEGFANLIGGRRSHRSHVRRIQVEFMLKLTLIGVNLMEFWVCAEVSGFGSRGYKGGKAKRWWGKEERVFWGDSSNVDFYKFVRLYFVFMFSLPVYTSRVWAYSYLFILF